VTQKHGELTSKVVRNPSSDTTFMAGAKRDREFGRRKDSFNSQSKEPDVHDGSPSACATSSSRIAGQSQVGQLVIGLAASVPAIGACESVFVLLRSGKLVSNLAVAQTTSTRLRDDEQCLTNIAQSVRPNVPPPCRRTSDTPSKVILRVDVDENG
jgi:hypothetical protein